MCELFVRFLGENEPVVEGVATCDLCGRADNHRHSMDEYFGPVSDDDEGDDVVSKVAISVAHDEAVDGALRIAQKKDGTLVIMLPDVEALLALAEAVEEAVLRVPLAERLAVIDAREN